MGGAWLLAVLFSIPQVFHVLRTSRLREKGIMTIIITDALYDIHYLSAFLGNTDWALWHSVTVNCTFMGDN